MTGDVTSEAFTEGVEHSWYEYPNGKSDLHPWDEYHGTRNTRG